MFSLSNYVMCGRYSLVLCMFSTMRLPTLSEFILWWNSVWCYTFEIIWTTLFLIKPNDALISQIYFCQETLRVSGSSSAHHQEFFAVHSALVYVMQVWWRLSSTTRMFVLESCQTCMTYTSAECRVEISWWWAEDVPETCRVSWQK
jgi:hypothetical protein